MKIYPVYRWIATAAIFPVTFSLAPILSAAPPDKCEPWPTCKDGGDPPDGGGSPSQNPTDALWVGSVSSSSAVGRRCLLESAQDNGDHGVYVCQLGEPNVLYDLTGVPRRQTERKSKNPELCALFDGVTLEPDSKYNYAWIDNCQDDGMCTARILNWFSEAEMLSAFPESGVGHTRFEAFADIPSPGSDSNPFASYQLLDVDLISVSFSGVGTNKRLATCEFDLSESLGAVQFQSTPQ